MCNCLEELEKEFETDETTVVAISTSDNKVLIPGKRVSKSYYGENLNLGHNIVYCDRAIYCPICGKKY